MVRFSIRYILWVTLLFMLFYFEALSPLFVVNEGQTQLTLYITQAWVDAFQIPAQLNQETLHLNNGLNLLILHACNGLVPFLFLLAGIASYPTDLSSKILWGILAYLVVVLINTLRMLLITLVVVESPELFSVLHDWIGRYGVALLTLFVFYLYTQRVSITPNQH